MHHYTFPYTLIQDMGNRPNQGELELSMKLRQVIKTEVEQVERYSIFKVIHIQEGFCHKEMMVVLWTMDIIVVSIIQ